MNKALMRFIGLVLCVLLVPALVAPAFAETDEIRITSAEDLVKLAENCSLDTWSDGVKVVLMNDISLSDVDFDSIPIFNGSFDGGGHTIYDLSLKSAQSPCGLFLETGKDADIHNLYVSGMVSPGVTTTPWEVWWDATAARLPPAALPEPQREKARWAAVRV